LNQKLDFILVLAWSITIFPSLVRLLDTLHLAGVLDTIYRILVSCTDERILSLVLNLLWLMTRHGNQNSLTFNSKVFSLFLWLNNVRILPDHLVASKVNIQNSALEMLQNLASHTSSEIKMLSQKILSLFNTF
jgi:hypothetical protein